MPHQSQTNTFRIRICGEAGEGISTAGELLLNAAVHSGLHATCVRYLPSNIRGGSSEALVTLCATASFSPVEACDMLVVVNPTAVAEAPPLAEHCVVLVALPGCNGGAAEETMEWFTRNGYHTIPIPVAEINADTAVGAASKAIVAIGVVGCTLNIGIGHFSASIEKRFGGKFSAEVDANLRVVTGAYGWAKRHLDRSVYPIGVPRSADSAGTGTRLVLDGNEAVALGALAAGCSFFASYPITPATSIGETLARLLPQQGGCAYQAEDEMAALGAVIGASFGGEKAFTATSGPGLSLMQEFIGYASMAEIPAVIVDVQRAGPSTGMPTRHGQDDLLAAAFGGHGEGLRIVLAPQGVEDCFTSTVMAFNYAERYLCPVIMLSDAALGLMKKSVAKAALVAPGLVARTAVGASSGIRRTTGIEHTGDGTLAVTGAERTAQVEQRMRKLRTIETEFDGAVEWDLETEGGAGPDIGVIAWGFTVAATREAVMRLRREGVRIAALYPRLLYPLCKESIVRLAEMSRVGIVVEANSSGQFCSLIGMVTGLQLRSFAVSRAEPIASGEIVEAILHGISPEQQGAHNGIV